MDCYRYIHLSLIALVVLGWFQVSGACAQSGERPNIVVIMADDMGYSDLGCYGGEIETPHLDALARNGLRFSQFYNTAKCHSSRVSLLTGQYCLAAGDTSLSHAVTTAEVLGDSGYFTAMSGKWHLDGQPTDFGFQRYFGHLSGQTNYFRGNDTFYLNGKPWNVPEQGFYTTVAKVDYALSFLSEARQTQQPWFLYLAFNAPHAPLHALLEDYEKYRGRYDEGWDRIREKRFERQLASGLLPRDLKPSPRPEHIPAWNALETWRQKYEANRMATLAAMMDRLDQEIGRLLNDIRENGEWDNTLIVFVSDNGACPYDRQGPVHDLIPTDADHYYSDSTGWAWARNTPFRYYKQNQYEGGISTPGIVHWPAGTKETAGQTIDQPVHLIDLLPTLADVTGSPIPNQWPHRELRPVAGVSLKPLMEGDSLESRPPIHLLFNSDRGLRDGPWKAVSFRNNAWELYDISQDRTELQNLASKYPDRLARMVDQWTRISQNELHAPKQQYAPVSEAGPPHHHREWTRFGRQDSKTAITRQNGPIRGIRARKNTQMTLEQQVVKLNFTGNDPGIAMDLRDQNLTPGPYQLRFQLKTPITGSGEIFFTDDRKTPLPQGTRAKFAIPSGDSWQAMAVDLDVTGRLFQIRLDIGDGSGQAELMDLQLVDVGGKVLKQWPTQPNAAR